MKRTLKASSTKIIKNKIPAPERARVYSKTTIQRYHAKHVMLS